MKKVVIVGGGIAGMTAGGVVAKGWGCHRNL